MRTSNPPSYDKVFPIRLGATATIAADAEIPPHRGLLIVSTGTVTGITFKNLDNTTSLMYFVAGSIVLPLQIHSYSGSGTVYIYGLI